jgi:hypothetical protein
MSTAVGDVSRALKERVKRRLGDVDGTMYTTNEIYMWLSEAIRDIVSRVPDMTIPEYCVTASYNGTTSVTGIYAIVAGRSYYTLPPDFLRERGLTWSSDDVWATRISLDQVASKVELWNQGDTEPYYYIWKGRIYLMVGTVGASDEFRLYYVKTPDDWVVTLNTSDVEELAAETNLAGGARTAIGNLYDPIIPRYYFRAMEDYAVARCLEARGFWDRARILLGDYEASLQNVVARYINNVLPSDHQPSEAFGIGRATQ